MTTQEHICSSWSMAREAGTSIREIDDDYWCVDAGDNLITDIEFCPFCGLRLANRYKTPEVNSDTEVPASEEQLPDEAENAGNQYSNVSLLGTTAGWPTIRKSPNKKP